MKRSMVGSLVVWACVSAVSGQELVQELSWTALEKAGQLSAGKIEPGGPAGQHEQLKIDNPTDESKTVTLLDLKDPGVTAFRYAIEGSVRYEKVKRRSYLEMWNWFADGGMYFTRTLGDSGPLQSLEGSSDWRPFSLPFFSNEKGGVPKRIVVNVVFAGRGSMYLSHVRLLQYGDGKELQERLGVSQQDLGWWTARTGALIGTIGGTILGLLGGLIGALGGMGKARRFVLTLTATLVGFGVVSLVIGVIAAAFGQPYPVYFPLMLLGGILAGVCGGNLPSLRRRYEQIELRKMAAMDSR